MNRIGITNPSGIHWAVVGVCALLANPTAAGCPFGKLLPGADHDTATSAPAALPIGPLGLGGQHELRALAETYGVTLVPGDNRQMSVRDYQFRARNFANDTLDHRSLYYEFTSPFTRQTSRLKVHLDTGEVLIGGNGDKVAIYTRLPVGERPLGTFADMGEVFRGLSGTVRISGKSNGRSLPALAVGESLGAHGFRRAEDREAHFRKHVLGIKAPLSPAEAVAAIPSRGTGEFLVMRHQLTREYAAAEGNAKRQAKAWQDAIDEYEAAAVNFANSTGSHIITMTRQHHREGREDTNTLSYKFDPFTRELAIVDRNTGVIITYYRVDPSLVPANQFLKRRGLPPVKTPFEYFLVMSTLPP